jgi:hypothetical protein
LQVIAQGFPDRRVGRTQGVPPTDRHIGDS